MPLESHEESDGELLVIQASGKLSKACGRSVLTM